MRRETAQEIALSRCFEDEPEVSGFEIAEAAVDQLRRAAAGAAREVALVDDEHGETAQRRLARDRRAVDPGADHDQIEVVAGGAGLGRDGGFLSAQGRVWPDPRTWYL